MKTKLNLLSAIALVAVAIAPVSAQGSGPDVIVGEPSERDPELRYGATWAVSTWTRSRSPPHRATWVTCNLSLVRKQRTNTR